MVNLNKHALLLSTVCLTTCLNLVWKFPEQLQQMPWTEFMLRDKQDQLDKIIKAVFLGKFLSHVIYSH